MELDEAGFILGLTSLSLTLIMMLLRIKRHPANDTPSTYNAEVKISVESEAQNKKIADMNARLFDNK